MKTDYSLQMAEWKRKREVDMKDFRNTARWMFVSEVRIGPRRAHRNELIHELIKFGNQLADTHLPASSTTVASMNSVDLSLTMTWQSSTSGDPAFSSSSSLEPDAVFVGASSGIIRDPLLLSNVVSASRLVCAMFSITLPPVVYSPMFGLRAALCFFARILSACRCRRFGFN